MIFSETIKIHPDDLAYINRLLDEEPETEENCLSEDDTISVTARFADGKEADIKVCGVQFEEGGYNTAWSEGVLFDEGGYEITCTDVEDYFDGAWEFEANGNIYRVVIEADASEERLHFPSAPHRAVS